MLGATVVTIGEVDGLDGWQRRFAAASVGLATMMAVLDGTMINVALPTISKALAVAPSAAVWVINAYQIAVAIILLPLGRAGDVFGRRPVYFVCLSIFTLGSIGCATAGGLLSLALWRIVQGLGGAGMMGITNAMLRFIYPARLLPRGMSTNTFVVTGTLALAPSIASTIVVLAGWRWLFIVNIPICILALLVGWRTLPEGRRGHLPLDADGMVLCMVTFGFVIVAMNAVAHGATFTLAAAISLAAVLSAIAMIRHQIRAERPIFPVDILRTRIFGISIITMVAAAAAQTIAYVAIPFMMQLDLGRSQLEIGILFLPWPIAQAAGAVIVGLIASRFGAGFLSGFGLLLFAAGLVSLATFPIGNAPASLVWRMALCGAGWGIFQPPNSRAIITSVASERTGTASVMGALGRVCGQAGGAALVASLFHLFPQSGRFAALWCAFLIAILAATASFSRGMNRSAAPAQPR